MADIVTTALTISENIISQCNLAQSLDASLVDGFTLTSIKPTTLADLDTVYTDNNDTFRITATLIEPDFMGAACARKRNGFAELIKKNTRVLDGKRLTVESITSRQYRVQPFLRMGVKNPINNKLWSFTTGTAAGSGATTPNTAVAYEWRVVVTSQTGVPKSAAWFRPGTSVTLRSVTAGQVAVTAYYKVLDANLSGSTLTLYLDNISDNAADGLYAAINAARGNPVTGILTRGIANIAPSESFCNDRPALNTEQEKLFWLGFSRKSFRVSDDVKELQKLILDNNPLYKKFAYVEDAQRIKQMMEEADEELATSFLFSSALPNQTLAGYASLEKIAFYAGNAASPTFAYAGRYDMYRSQPQGLFAQFAACDNPDTGEPSLEDWGGAKIDLATLHERIFRLLQMRKSLGRPGKVFEMMMHSRMVKKFMEAYIQYFKSLSVDTLRMNFDVKGEVFGFSYRDIELDWPNVTIRLIANDSLDDYRDAFQYHASTVDTSLTSTWYNNGNLILMIDWDSNYRLVMESRKNILKSGTLEEIAKVDQSMLCVADGVPQDSVTHWWDMHTFVSECPLASAIYQNFDDSGVLQTPEA